MNEKPIRVLLVDDSLLFREALTRGIERDPCIRVVAKAADAYEAREKIISHSPDVMLCDVEMPKLNGIDFIRMLLPKYSIPVIVVSSASEKVLAALEVGAVDFISKPQRITEQAIGDFFDDLCAKIKVAAKAKVKGSSFRGKAAISQIDVAAVDKLVAIGASTGGTEAIYTILKSLPRQFPGIVIVQHIPVVFSGMFAERLNNQTELQVKEAQTGDYVEQGKVLIAPGDRHMRLKKVGSRYRVECFEGPKVNGHCPSVDVLFESVAKEAGSKVVGVILTGMGRDGAGGLLAMRKGGARTIGQNEASCVVYGMPKAAYELGAVERQVSLDQIPQAMIAFLK